MAYVPLTLPDKLPESVDWAIRKVVEPLLEDIHWMLASPTGRPGKSGPPRQLQLPIALLLLATVEGVSTKLFQPAKEMGVGKRFKECLIRYYPWDIDPPTGVSREDAAKTLYVTFRNPLVHRLGLHDSKCPGVRFGQSFPGDGAESGLERLERSRKKPASEPFLIVTPDRRTLWLDPFYWGVRILIERWSCDTTQVSRADEKFRKTMSERSA